MKNILTALKFSVIMIIICGLLYPVAMTGISQVVFPYQANGSIIEIDGVEYGSEIMGQQFTDERLFHGRPSAYNYNTYTEEQKENGEYAGLSSGGSNMANSNEALQERIALEIERLLEENPTITVEDIPEDMVTMSGSGLDPHISVAGAMMQVDRVSSNTGLSTEEVTNLIEKHTEGKVLGIFGEEKVNVLELNLELAQIIGMI